MLLDFGADVELRNGQGYTPLLIACIKRNIQVIRMLLEHKCDIRAGDRDQRSPLHWAALSGYEGARSPCSRVPLVCELTHVCCSGKMC